MYFEEHAIPVIAAAIFATGVTVVAWTDTTATTVSMPAVLASVTWSTIAAEILSSATVATAETMVAVAFATVPNQSAAVGVVSAPAVATAETMVAFALANPRPAARGHL